MDSLAMRLTAISMKREFRSDIVMAYVEIAIRVDRYGSSSMIPIRGSHLDSKSPPSKTPVSVRSNTLQVLAKFEEILDSDFREN